MVIFQSEADLLNEIAKHDALVEQCVSGAITFEQFLDSYNSFYYRFALDGHESDDEERQLLSKHARLIAPHRAIANDVLGRVCSDADLALESYKQAGRIGSGEAIKRMREVSSGA